MNRTNGSAIEFVDVVKTFPSLASPGGEQVVLGGVSFQIPKGRTTVIVGGSGQGKSVSLKLALGLLRADSGRVLVDDTDVSAMSRNQLNVVRSRFGVLFQGAALFDSLTVFENVAMPLQERTRMKRDAVAIKVFDVLAKLGLMGHENKYPAQLSGGMRKRVGLARALQLSPEIMFFDEPTTGLDPLRTHEIYQLLFDTQQEYGYTSVIVSHDIPQIFNLADKIIVLLDGCVSQFHGSEELYLSREPQLEKFLQITMGHVYVSGEYEPAAVSLSSGNGLQQG